MVHPPSTQEGVRQFHTFANDRELTVMGLFRSFVVEPVDPSTWKPWGTGRCDPDRERGWQVSSSGTAPVRISANSLYYHEVGDEAFRPVNKKGDFLPA